MHKKTKKKTKKKNYETFLKVWFKLAFFNLLITNVYQVFTYKHNDMGHACTINATIPILLIPSPSIFC